MVKFSQGYFMIIHIRRINRRYQEFMTEILLKSQTFILSLSTELSICRFMHGLLPHMVILQLFFIKITKYMKYFSISIYLQFSLLFQYLSQTLYLKVDQNKLMNQTQLVRSFLNVFIVVAIGVSLFQQLINNNNNRINPNTLPPSVTTPAGQQVPLQMTGPKVQGILIRSSDKFHTPLKQLLAKNQYNIEITSYQFQGNQYYLNLVLNWGHIVLVYFLIGKYKTQTNEATKKKIMIGGGLIVMAWFFLTPSFKPQRFAIQVQGSKVYQKEQFDQRQILDLLSQYDFQLEDMKEAQNNINPQVSIPTKDDAWDSENTQPRKVQDKPVQSQYAQDQF